jgi:hypothetical protein
VNAVDSLRDRFFGWQCRIRQIAMRQDGGRPSPGMRPLVLAGPGEEIAALTVLLVPREPDEVGAFFRFQVEKSADPREVYERGLAFLQADYFQDPKAFSDLLVAVLPEGSSGALSLEAAGVCVLEFDQWRQRFRVPCAVRLLSENDAARAAAVWHNRLFNPLLSDAVHVVAFQPDWAAATADP